MKKVLAKIKLDSSLVGPLFIAGAAILWAFDGILRRSLYSLPPLTIVFYEHLVGSVLLLPWFGQSVLAKLKKISKETWFYLVLIALFSGLLGTLWFTTALGAVNFIPFSVVFLLQKLQPIFAIISAKILLKEKLNQKYFGWMGLALVAGYFVTFPNGMVNLNDDGGLLIAALYALGAALVWGVSTSFSKKVLQKMDYVQAAGLRFWLTSIFAGLSLLIFKPQVLSLMPDASQWVRLTVIALSTGMVSLLLYYKGLKKTKVKVSTIIELLFPLLAVIIDVVMYKTWLMPSQYLAAGVLLWTMFRVSKLNKVEIKS